MTTDLSAVDVANTALQADPKAAKTTKAYAKTVTDVLHAMNPAPPPPSSLLLGCSNNVGGGGSLDILTRLGAKITREDTAAAFGQLGVAGIKCVQIIQAGQTAAADSRAYCFQVGGNEPYFVPVDPAVYFPQVAADVQALRGKYPSGRFAVPLLAYGWSGFGNVDDHGNYTWNGTTKPWVEWLVQYAPSLLTTATLWEVHPYGTRGLANMDLIRSQLSGHGAAQPFIVGEDGWSTYGNSEQAQADYLSARIAAITSRTDTAAWILYRAQDLVGQSNPAENNYGVERTNPDWSDGGPKIAFGVVQKAFA